MFEHNPMLNLRGACVIIVKDGNSTTLNEVAHDHTSSRCVTLQEMGPSVTLQAKQKGSIQVDIAHIFAFKLT